MKESPTTVTKKQGWGGKRAGSGRKPGPYAWIFLTISAGFSQISVNVS